MNSLSTPRLRSLAGLSLVAAVCVLAVACADRTPGKYVRVLSSDDQSMLRSWRTAIAIYIAVQYVTMLWASQALKASQRVAYLVRSLILLPLAWTKIGEWWYRLCHLVIQQGEWGILAAAIVFMLAGISGVGNLMMLVLTSFIFLDIDMLRYLVVPSLISATLLNIITLSQAVTE